MEWTKKLMMLMILDGFGINENEQGNAVKLSKTPNIDKLMKTCPTSTVYTSGLKLDFQKDKWEIQK